MSRSSRTAVALMAAASTMPTVITVANAGEVGGGPSSLAKREMIRRQNDVREADRLLAEGRAAYAKGDFQQAVDKYKQALDLVPNAPMFQDRRQSYTGHLSDASVALAMEHRKVGKYSEARMLLEGVLAENPSDAAATRELGYLDDPIRTNPALDYEHTQNVDKVRRTLYTAEGNFNLGKYDDAKIEYENVCASTHTIPPPVVDSSASPPPAPITIALPMTTLARNCFRRSIKLGNYQSLSIR
jgi:general secretion pathway protein D